MYDYIFVNIYICPLAYIDIYIYIYIYTYIQLIKTNII